MKKIAFLLVLVLLLAATASATWWNGSWHSKRAIHVLKGDNPAGKTVVVPVDFTSISVLSDLNDLRVIDENTGQQLDRITSGPSTWMDGNSSTTGFVYFKLPYTLDSNTDTNTTFYLYFSNPSAGAPPNADTCFGLCDGLEDGNIAGTGFGYSWNVIERGHSGIDSNSVLNGSYSFRLNSSTSDNSGLSDNLPSLFSAEIQDSNIQSNQGIFFQPGAPGSSVLYGVAINAGDFVVRGVGVGAPYVSMGCPEAPAAYSWYKFTIIVITPALGDVQYSVWKWLGTRWDTHFCTMRTNAGSGSPIESANSIVYAGQNDSNFWTDNISFEGNAASAAIDANDTNLTTQLQVLEPKSVYWSYANANSDGNHSIDFNIVSGVSYLRFQAAYSHSQGSFENGLFDLNLTNVAANPTTDGLNAL